MYTQVCSSIIHNSQKVEAMDEWINKTWCIHTVEHYSALKRKIILKYALTWMNLEDIVLSEISQSQ